MSEKKVYLIECRTGCSCCASDNHFRGPYRTKEEAQARIDRFKRGVNNPVASQYSKTGNYSIDEFSYEEISGDRMIIGETKVLPLSSLVSVNLEDGSIGYGLDDYLESTNDRSY